MVETHDRLVGRTYREAARACEAQLGDETAAVREALRAFADLGTALIGARDTREALDTVIADGPGWVGLDDLVTKAAALASTAVSDPLNHVLGGYSRFRRYTPRMLRTLDIEASLAAEPLLEAVGVLRSNGTARPTGFLRPNSRWSRLLRTQPDHRLWETAVLFHLRDAFRAGDVWLARSRRYGDIRKALLAAPAVADADRSLPVPASPHDWLAERRFALDEGLRRLAAAARAGATTGESIEDSVLRVERTETAVPDGAADLVADLYRRLPEARITDILLEVDDATRFTEAFTHLRTGEPCRDRIGLLNVLLAEGINLGLRKMDDFIEATASGQASRSAAGWTPAVVCSVGGGDLHNFGAWRRRSRDTRPSRTASRRACGRTPAVPAGPMSGSATTSPGSTRGSARTSTQPSVSSGSTRWRWRTRRC